MLASWSIIFPQYHEKLNTAVLLCISIPSALNINFLTGEGLQREWDLSDRPPVHNVDALTFMLLLHALCLLQTTRHPTHCVPHMSAP